MSKRAGIEEKLLEKRLDTEALLYAMLKDHKHPNPDSLKLYAFQLGLAKAIERSNK